MRKTEIKQENKFFPQFLFDNIIFIVKNQLKRTIKIDFNKNKKIVLQKKKDWC